MNRSKLAAAFLGLIVLTVCLSLWGCWADDEWVTIENRSSEVVVVFEGGVPTTLLHPRVTEKFSIPRFSGSLTYSVQSFETREILAERTFTWDDIVREDGITIVIE